MEAPSLRYRQVHLDFHTSGDIPDIAGEFDAASFAGILAEACVNSVTCFARCHHGYIYYNTRLFPERRHPNLGRDLLEEQIEACHRRDIRVPIYITVQWDHFTAEEHPEWLIWTAEGRIEGTPPYEPGFYRRLCLNSPYVDFLKEHTREVLLSLPCDGLFFDIVDAQDCSCPRCRAGMRAAYLDPADPEARRAYGRGVLHRFQREMTTFVRKHNKTCSIFYNAGHIGPRHRALAETYSHFELESLPSGGWGYMHFPLAMRYARTLGRDCLGMTGKFHTSWGDFHSLKNRAALEFECFDMLALNAKCSIGDQLHPDGKLCRATYELIGSVYRSVQEKEPWCAGASPVTEIGVLTPEEFSETGKQPRPTLGAARMLQEGAHQFDILDSRGDFGKYRVLVLPDEAPVDEELAKRLQGYVDGGGAIIASYRSGLTPEGDAFASDLFGVSRLGEAPYSPDFLVPSPVLAQGIADTEHVMYLRGLEVEPLPGAQRLAEVAIPYFNRSHEHFCSHRHTPSSHTIGYPGAVRQGRVIYFAHPVFTQYQANAPRWCKQLVLNALDMLLPEPLVRLNAPSTALATVNAQYGHNRWILHLLHYVPERRGADFDSIEDVIPLRDVQVSLRVPRLVADVICVPQNQELEFKKDGGSLHFTVPEVSGHQMVAIQFS